MIVEENGGDALYFAKCRGFFRDGNGDHVVAVQWFNYSQHRNVDPTLKLPKLTLANPEMPPAYSIMPASAIVNGALLIPSGTKKWRFCTELRLEMFTVVSSSQNFIPIVEPHLFTF